MANLSAQYMTIVYRMLIRLPKGRDQEEAPRLSKQRVNRARRQDPGRAQAPQNRLWGHKCAVFRAHRPSAPPAPGAALAGPRPAGCCSPSAGSSPRGHRSRSGQRHALRQGARDRPGDGFSSGLLRTRSAADLWRGRGRLRCRGQGPFGPAAAAGTASPP